MRQDKTTGAFHFEGDEDEIVLRYVWTCLMDLSWYRIIEVFGKINKSLSSYLDRKLNRKKERREEIITV